MSLNRVPSCLRLLGILVRHVQEKMFRPLPFVSLLLNISFRWHQRIEQNWQSKFAELHEQASWSLEVLWCLRIYLISSVLRLVHFSFRFVLKKKKMLNYGISSVLWAPFALKLFPKKAFLHEPDRYGEQSSLQVNSYRESSAIDAGFWVQRNQLKSWLRWKKQKWCKLIRF